MSRRKFKPWVELQPREIEDNLFAMDSVRFSAPNSGGLPHESDRIEITVGQDGHIHFSDTHGENWIYFYPEQVKHLRRALAALRCRAAEKRGEG